MAFSLQVGPVLPELVNTNFTLGMNGQTYATIPQNRQSRQYHLLVPDEDLDGNDLIVDLQSATTATSDQRMVGLQVEEAALDILEDNQVVWPTLAQIVLQCLLLALFAVLLWQLGVPQLFIGAGPLLAAAGLAIGYSNQPLLFFLYLTRLVVALAFLILLTYWLLPRSERYLRSIADPRLVQVLWGIAILACIVRLLGALYPTFDAYDLQLNVGRLLKTMGGQLIDTNRSIEFRNSVAVYPAGPYLAFLPVLLLGLTPKLVVQASIALVDGFGALATAVLARAFGASSRTAIFCALVYAAVPVSLTALWYGLTAQVFGQALMAPLAVALLWALQRRGARYWVAASILLTISLLSHIGVAIMAVAWLGLAWLLVSFRRKFRQRVWQQLTLVLVTSGIASFLFVYGAVVLLGLEQTRDVGEKVLTSNYAPAYNLIWRGFLIAFHPLGFLLLLPGFLLLWRRPLPFGARTLIGCWIAIVALFWAIEMVSALQVRYIYFLTPLACILAGLCLDQLTRRGRIAHITAWMVLLLLFMQGTAIWWTGTFQHVAMSMVSLLR